MDERIKCGMCGKLSDDTFCSNECEMKYDIISAPFKPRPLHVCPGCGNSYINYNDELCEDCRKSEV